MDNTKMLTQWEESLMVLDLIMRGIAKVTLDFRAIWKSMKGGNIVDSYYRNLYLHERNARQIAKQSEREAWRWVLVLLVVSSVLGLALILK